MPAEQQESIVVLGARVHNLKNITVEIPANSLTVVTGVSGSGKSSLAFDTLYAEGQRRYVSSLSAYARQFLERIDRPDVDDIRGICPALAIRQKNYSRNPRSTVGTVTEVNDYLRLLYSRIGVTHCHSCGRIVEKDTPDKIADFVMSLPAGTRFYVCMRLSLEEPQASRQVQRRASVASRRVSRPEEQLGVILPGLQQQGFVRLLIGSRTVELSNAVEALRGSEQKEVHVVVDRLVVQDDIRKRLVDSLEACGREADGRIEILLMSDDPHETEPLLEKNYPQIRWVRHPAGILVKFSERFECQLCRLSYEEPEPRLFSFNNPFGACPECQGFGNTITLDLNLVIPDGSKGLSQRAVNPWTKPRYRHYQTRLIQFAQREEIPTEVPWSELSEKDRDLVIHGKGSFTGILGFFEALEEKKYKMHVRIFVSRYRGYATCMSCRGERLRQEARDVTVGGKRISEVTQLTTRQASEFFSGLRLTPQELAITGKILDEIRHRLALLVKVGLDYITLDRLSSSLSGGESQRIQLATSLGSTLVGALYVLDEPSIGLHPRDSQRLIEILRSLKSLGNTVLVVEHDPEIMGSADYVIDLGPRAGEFGGQVVYQGKLGPLLEDPKSLTGRYLRGELKITTPLFRRKPNGRYLEILGARKHNLRGLDVCIPLGMFVCITGVSGSGKSTLVHDVLYAAVRRAKGESTETTDGCSALRGVEQIAEAVLVDQSPIGRTPRSNPVTYIKAFDDIREIFAETRDAYARNLGPGHFSFNLAGGRCESCQGSGTITVEMQFLADVDLICDECKGRRFKSKVLEVKYKGKNIAEVLDLTVHEAIDFFAGNPRLIRKLKVLEEIGLGYLRLGQSATSLSGGEAQRIKLASFIARKNAPHSLYIFDEPTTGLHFDDIRKLLAAFDKLVNSGNSIVVIEHNLDVVKMSDWVIDLGPEGGAEGGRIVFQGSPDDLLNCQDSHTARFLKRYLNGSTQLLNKTK
ncbi:MAG TPA: excinuclease ABC subunit UvrA [Acidobacteriota bacterium]|nr:excinuclease ABC subunit UvrA [Acidobacteriota bacterium]